MSYLPDTNGMDIQVFDQDSLSDQYYLDTSHCITKSKRFNNQCLYNTFAEYCTLTGVEVKSRLMEELKTREEWYIKASAACLGMRGVKYKDWLKKLEKARWWPNELALYSLCILFRQNACVFNNGHIWTTLDVEPNMTVGTIQEMCETTLLYLGNNIYGILRCRPFTLERPIPFDLDNMQHVRPLTYDNNVHHMFLKLRMNSDYERLVTEEEILIPPDIKPQITPVTNTKSILDADYNPPATFIKEEPVEQDQTTQRTIGELITQPDYIAEAIKQKMIDTTAAALAITHKHSPTCDLNRYVEMHGGIDSLQIKDVRSLLRTDQAVFPEMIPVSSTIEDPTTMEIKGSSLKDGPPVHANNVPSLMEGVHPVTPVLCVVTSDPNTAIPRVTRPSSNVIASPAVWEVSTDTSLQHIQLPVVTTMASQHQFQAMSTGPPHVVTASTTCSSADPVITPTSSTSSPMEKTMQLKWSRVLNRPVETEPSVDVETAETDIPLAMNTTLSMVTSKADKTDMEDQPITSSIDKYYEVLTLEQNDVVFISHVHIMNSRCTVQLERISDDNQNVHDTGMSEQSSQTSSTESIESQVPKKKPCYRPKRKPSKARVRAQQIIAERKKNKQTLT